MKIDVEIIGTAKEDSPSSFVYHTENYRYSVVIWNVYSFLFNAGEGTQRMSLENKIKLSKVQHIFLSNLSLECCGGLLGIISNIIIIMYRNVAYC